MEEQEMVEAWPDEEMIQGPEDDRPDVEDCPECGEDIAVVERGSGLPSMMGHGIDPDVVDLACGHRLTWSPLDGTPSVRLIPDPDSWVEPEFYTFEITLRLSDDRAGDLSWILRRLAGKWEESWDEMVGGEFPILDPNGNSVGHLYVSSEEEG